MYLIFTLSILASLFEGIEILMLLPLLQTIDNSSSQAIEESEINKALYEFIEFLGLSYSIPSILILISISFLIKGVMTFFALGYNAYLSGELLKELKIKLFKLCSSMKYSYYISKILETY